MLDRIERAIGLAQASWQVLRTDKELLVLPVLGIFASVIVGAVAFSPFLLAPPDFEEGTMPPAGVWVFLALAVTAVTATGLLFHGAVMAGAYQRFTGKNPTIGTALSAAWTRLLVIVQFAAVTTVVSFAAGLLKSRGLAGRLAGAAVEIAWNVLSYLAFPIVVLEGASPAVAVRKSKDLLRRTWGEQLTTHVGLSVLGVVGVAPMLLLVFAAPAVTSTSGTMLLLFGLSAAWAVGVSLVIAALDAVVRVALYLYANEQPIPSPLVHAGIAETIS